MNLCRYFHMNLLEYAHMKIDIPQHIEKPIVISFLQEKGGAGKTTLATNVAHGLKLRGFSVLLVDNDPQGSSRDWNEENQGQLLPVIGLDRETIAKDIKAIKEGFDFIIIDGAPQLTRLSAAAIRASDIVLIPVQPSPYDVWASSNLVELIKARKEINNEMPHAAFIISRAIKNSKLSKEVSDSIKEYGLPVFKSHTTQFVVYPTTASIGQTVFNSTVGTNPASMEISAIIDEIFEEFLL